jgi:hypothetical protein
MESTGQQKKLSAPENDDSWLPDPYAEARIELEQRREM